MPDLQAYSGMPRWVKVCGIIVLGLVLLAAGLWMTGIGGPHGPSRHIPPDEPVARLAPSSAIEPGRHRR